MTNTIEMPKGENKEPKITELLFFIAGDEKPRLAFACHSWFAIEDDRNYILLNHFQDQFIVNMSNFDYMSAREIEQK